MPGGGNQPKIQQDSERYGGEAGIRTLGARLDTPDFESGPFGRSGTSPRARIVVEKGDPV